MQKELYRSKDDDSDEDENPKSGLPFGTAKSKPEAAPPKEPVRPNRVSLGGGIIELHHDDPQESEGHLYEAPPRFVPPPALEEVTREDSENEEDDDDEDEGQDTPAEVTESAPRAETETVAPASVEEPLGVTQAPEAGLMPEDAPEETGPAMAESSLDALPPITEREQPDAEDTASVPLGSEQPAEQPPAQAPEEWFARPPMPEADQFEAETVPVPPYAEAAPYPNYGEQPAKFSRNMPMEQPVKQTKEYVPVGDSRVGPLAFLLGLEYFARKRAIRKVEKRAEKQMDEKLARYESAATEDRQRQVREAYARLQPEIAPAGRERIATEAADEALARINLERNQHVEQSAWHSFAVDKRGHIVTDAIHYGEGFQREQQQEVRRRDQVQKAPAVAPVFIPKAPTMSSLPSSDPGQSSLPSGMTMPALPEGVPEQVDAQHRLAAARKQDIAGLNPVWLWLLFLLILAAIITALLS